MQLVCRMSTKRQTIQIARIRSLSAFMPSPPHRPGRALRAPCGACPCVAYRLAAGQEHRLPHPGRHVKRLGTPADERYLVTYRSGVVAAQHTSRQRREREHARSHGHAGAQARAPTPAHAGPRAHTRRHRRAPTCAHGYPHGGVRASFYWSGSRVFLYQNLAQLPVAYQIAGP